MSTTYTANIVVGLHAEDLEDWAQENDELLDDLFDYFPHADVYGLLYTSTEDSTELVEGDGGLLDRLIEEFKRYTGKSPKVMLVVDSY